MRVELMVFLVYFGSKNGSSGSLPCIALDGCVSRFMPDLFLLSAIGASGPSRAGHTEGILHALSRTSHKIAGSSRG